METAALSASTSGLPKGRDARSWRAAARSPWRARRRHAPHRRALHGERAAARQERASRPFGRPEVEALSAAVSIASGVPYGVRHVCSVWGVARSTFYAAPPGAEAARRGPAPAVADCLLYTS